MELDEGRRAGEKRECAGVGVTIRICANQQRLSGLKNKICLDRMSDAGWGMQYLTDRTALVGTRQLVGVEVQNLDGGRE